MGTRPTGSAAHCPDCGRFVGPEAICPFCGRRARLPLRFLRWASLLLALAGVAVLLLVAPHARVPTWAIGALTPTMNWAYLRLEGLASRQPAIDPDSGALKIWIQDGTGEIMAMAYPAEARALQDAGRVPVMGDAVTLEGTLRVREDFSYLVINLPQAVEVRPAEAPAVTVDQVHTGLLGRQVRLRGQVRGQRSPYDGLHLLTLRDETAAIEVLLPSGDAPGGPPPGGFVPGQALEVTGAVDRYGDTLQISVGRWSDLVPLPGGLAVAAARRTGDVSPADVGRLARVQGTVRRVSTFSAGLKLAIDDGSGPLTLLLWDDLLRALPGAGLLAQGASVDAQGEVAAYRGDLELVPEIPADLEVRPPPATATPARVPGSPPSPTPTRRADPLPAATATARPGREPSRTPAPTPSSPPTAAPSRTPTPVPSATRPAARTIGSITGSDAGTTVSLARAGIAEISYFSRGVSLTLTDASGSIRLLLWQNVLEEIPDRLDLFPGSQVQVSGQVQEYQGALEIVPAGPGDVRLLARGERPPVEERAVGSITAADEGRFFAVAGTVSRLESRGWLRMWLNDGSGEILVFLPERVLPYLPAGLGPGVQVAVTGEVDVFQGALEIIPLAGADVARR